MTPRKFGESMFHDLAKGYGWYTHKYGDVRYCLSCHTVLPKSELAPDYSLGPVYTWVECKNSDQDGRWSWAIDIGPEGKRKAQRKWLQDNGGWLFVVLGTEPLPKGKQAWLIPWTTWLRCEERMGNFDMKSLRNEPSGKKTDKDYHPPAGDIIPENCRLVWEKGKWIIPKGHSFWYSLRQQAEALLLCAQQNL